MQNIPIEKETNKNNNVEDLFNPIYKINEVVNENNLKQILDESTIIYFKKEIQKFKAATDSIIEKRKKLEEQNVLLQTEENDFEHNTETFTNSSELKLQLIATLKQQTDINHNELNRFKNKCANTINTFQKEYEDVKETYKNKHSLYFEHKNVNTSALKVEIELKMLQKKYADLKKQHKLRLKINHQLFNQSIVKLVQAIVDYRKRNSKTKKIDEKMKTVVKDTNLQDYLVKHKNSNISLDLDALSLNLKLLPQFPPTIFEVSPKTHVYNHDKIALQIQARSEQRQKEWKQRHLSFSFNKRSSLTENVLKQAENVSANKINTMSNLQTNISAKGNESDFIYFDPTTTNNEQLFSPYQQVTDYLTEQRNLHKVMEIPSGKRASTVVDDLPKKKKINIIDVQTFIAPEQTEKDTISMYFKHDSRIHNNEFMYPFHPPTSIHVAEQKKESQILLGDNVSSTFSQQPKTVPHMITQESYNFEASQNNTLKPNLNVSQFDISKTVERNKNLENEDFTDLSPQNMLSPYIIEQDAQSATSLTEEPYMSMMSLMSPSNNSETNGNNVCIPTQPQYTFNFGQTNATQSNLTKPNTPLFGKTTSSLFNMFS